MWIANLPAYKALTGARSRKISDKLSSLLEDEISILDFGCGNFLTALALAKTHPHISFTGLDVVEDQNANRAEIEKSGHHLVVYPGGPLPFADASFDAIMAVSSLHHTPDPDGFIRELKRVTKPGGHLYIIEEMYLHLPDRIWISAQDWTLNKMKKGVPVPLQFRSLKHYLSLFKQEQLALVKQDSLRPGFPWMHHYVFKLKR